MSMITEMIVKANNELFSNPLPLAAIADNAHGQEMTATCFQLRDMNYYLRLISYSVIE